MAPPPGRAALEAGRGRQPLVPAASGAASPPPVGAGQKESPSRVGAVPGPGEPPPASRVQWHSAPRSEGVGAGLSLWGPRKSKSVMREVGLR